MVFWALEHALGGEILVPKIPSYRICDVAEAIGPNCKKRLLEFEQGRNYMKK
jgi:UDP-N-acetylglucosamine 4,6-dehydratase/5-epimerase